MWNGASSRLLLCLRSLHSLQSLRSGIIKKRNKSLSTCKEINCFSKGSAPNQDQTSLEGPELSASLRETFSNKLKEEKSYFFTSSWRVYNGPPCSPSRSPISSYNFSSVCPAQTTWSSWTDASGFKKRNVHEPAEKNVLIEHPETSWKDLELLESSPGQNYLLPFSTCRNQNPIGINRKDLKVNCRMLPMMLSVSPCSVSRCLLLFNALFPWLWLCVVPVLLPIFAACGLSGWGRWRRHDL